MKLAVISANFGGFDSVIDHVEQILPEGIDEIKFHRFTDTDYLPRKNSMTPRLQARIVKTHMWEFEPGFDYYLWIDSSCRLAREDSVKWFMEQLEGLNDIAVFKHPHRQTVQQEADYLKQRLSIDCPYVTPRYKNEDIDGQLAAIPVNSAANRCLFASTVFIYKNSPQVRTAMKHWWYMISRYHSIDQLSFPHAIRNLSTRIILDNYQKCKYLEYTRKHGHA